MAEYLITFDAKVLALAKVKTQTIEEAKLKGLRQSEKLYDIGI